MKKIKFIYNPFSGGKIILDHLDEIIHEYQKQNILVHFYRIDISKDEQDFFPEGIENLDYEYILISGGDGTVNRVINQMKERGINLPISILATGTANDFATAIGLSGVISEDIIKIIEGSKNKIDLIKVNGKYFINVLSMGLFTTTSQHTPTALKNSIGKLAYYISGIKDIPNFEKLELKITSEEFTYEGKCLIMFVFNGKTAGKMNISYKAELDDGQADVIIATAGEVAEVLDFILKFIKGEHLDTSDNIIHFKTKKLRIEAVQNYETDVDGEKGPDFPLDIECIHEGIEIIF